MPTAEQLASTIESLIDQHGLQPVAAVVGEWVDVTASNDAKRAIVLARAESLAKCFGWAFVADTLTEWVENQHALNTDNE